MPLKVRTLITSVLTFDRRSIYHRHVANRDCLWICSVRQFVKSISRRYPDLWRWMPYSEHIAEDLPALSSAVSDLVADARKRNLAVDDRNPQVTSAVAPSKAMTSLSNGSPSRYGLYVQPQAHVEPSSNVPPSFTDVWQALHPTRFEDVTEHVPVQLLQQQPTATMGNFPQPASLGTSPGSSAHLSPAVLDSLSSSTASASASTASSSGYTTLLEEAQQILPHIFPGQPLATPDLGTFAEYLNWDPADNPSFHDSL